MTTVRLGWAWAAVDRAALTAAGYDQQKVEAELDPTGAPGVWTEVTRATTRLPLVDPVDRYLWELPGDPAVAYRAVAHRTSDGADDPTPLAIPVVAARGYATVADMRAAGYPALQFPDATVQAALDYAAATIDRVCGQRFDAYYARVALDVPRPYDEVHLDQPIAALWTLADADGAIDLTDRAAIWVANRHLTQGLTAPDDRRDPRLEWGDAADPLGRARTVGRFARGRRALTLAGVFGFTEIGPADEVGEAVADSQLPLSYGSTPAEIRRACMLLADRYLFPLASGESTNMIVASRVTSERTRDQSYTLSEPAGAGADVTGHPEVDAILPRYAAPVSLGGV